uniref:CHAT domain-containing protein n=1 Tax=Candidatus Kentrum sp. DK TaxID=2126562 RepID=A0A450T5I5_9GAMM|nr:MAG: CHAT domain-containing protein [Candidatus Kentron sp. DK]
MKKIFGIAIFFLMLGVLSPFSLANPGNVVKGDKGEVLWRYGESHALLVGVGDYEHWSKRKRVSGKLDRVEWMLKKQGFEITRIDNPDSGQLSSTFDDFAHRYGSDEKGRLLFFFAGHGYNTSNDGKKGYLVARDTPNPHRNKAGVPDKALSMDRILDQARAIKAPHALFLFDSCLSDGIFQDEMPGKELPGIAASTAHPVRRFISAGPCDKGDVLATGASFAQAFVDAIHYGKGDLNRDGYVTGVELGRYLKSEVSRYARRTPRFGEIEVDGEQGGDFVFVLPATEAMPDPVADLIEEIFWGSIRKSDDPDFYRTYLRDYPYGRFATIARERLRQSIPKSATGETARLVVRSNVTADTVYIDYLSVGPSGPAAHTLYAGEHIVQVVKEGYKPFETRVELAPGTRRTVRARLARAKAERRPIAISSTFTGYGIHTLSQGDYSMGDLGGTEAQGITLDQYQTDSGVTLKLPPSMGKSFQGVVETLVKPVDNGLLPRGSVKFDPGSRSRKASIEITGLDPGVSGTTGVTVEGVDADGSTVRQTFEVTVENGVVKRVKPIQGGDGLVPEDPGALVSRYPSIESPEQIQVAEEIEVAVSLTEERITPQVMVESFDPKQVQVTAEGQITLTTGTIDVSLSAPGFQYLGDSLKSIELRRTGDSTRAVFRLRANKIPNARQTRNLFVTFYHEDAYLAEVSREVDVIDPGKFAAAPAPRTTTGNKKAGRRSAKKPAFGLGSSGVSVFRMSGSLDAARLSENARRKTPDLTVVIVGGENVDNRHETEITIRSPHLRDSTLTLKDRYTQKELTNWLKGRYTKLFAEANRRGDSISPMRGLGRDLYHQYAPEVFKKAFWKLVEKLGKDFDSIQIVTNQPHLPWELMIPSRPDRSDEQDFLGVRYRMARWHRPLIRPPQSLPLSDIAVIAPRYHRESDRLPWREKELEVLRGMPGYRGVPGRYGDVKTFFSAWPPGIIHFAGHGNTGIYRGGIRGYTLKLEDKDLDVDLWRGFPPGNIQDHPFFFFSACHAGVSHRIAHIVEGWAPAILEAGASGYVGALWSIGDKGAADFGIRFYRTLQQELDKKGTVTVSDVLRKTRERFRKTGDPTYLSYIFYGDPDFRFVRQAP